MAVRYEYPGSPIYGPRPLWPPPMSEAEKRQFQGWMEKIRNDPLLMKEIAKYAPREQITHVTPFRGHTVEVAPIIDDATRQHAEASALNAYVKTGKFEDVQQAYHRSMINQLKALAWSKGQRKTLKGKLAPTASAIKTFFTTNPFIPLAESLGILEGRAKRKVLNALYEAGQRRPLPSTPVTGKTKAAATMKKTEPPIQTPSPPAEEAQQSPSESSPLLTGLQTALKAGARTAPSKKAATEEKTTPAPYADELARAEQLLNQVISEKPPRSILHDSKKLLNWQREHQRRIFNLGARANILRRRQQSLAARERAKEMWRHKARLLLKNEDAMRYLQQHGVDKKALRDFINGKGADFVWRHVAAYYTVQGEPRRQAELQRLRELSGLAEAVTPGAAPRYGGGEFESSYTPSVMSPESKMYGPPLPQVGYVTP